MRIIILGKAPVPGRVKTRLMPEYSAVEAAALHARMMETVLKKVCSCFDDVWLAVDDIHHEVVKSLVKRFRIELHAQVSGDLGKRLQALMRESLARDEKPLMFLGTDSPHVAIQRYQAAKTALKQHDIVVGAVEDGGYDLIAVRQNLPEVFEYIPWGSALVMRETLKNINKLNLDVKVLPTSFDLDKPEDLRRAPPASW